MPSDKKLTDLPKRDVDESVAEQLKGGAEPVGRPKPAEPTGLPKKV